MAQMPGWRVRKLNETVFQEHGLHVVTGIAHGNHWKAYGDLEVFACIRVQRYHVYILNGLTVSCLVMEPHGFCSAHVDSLSSV